MHDVIKAIGEIGLVPVVNLVFLVFLMFVPADDGLLKKTNRTTAQTPEPSP